MIDIGPSCMYTTASKSCLSQTVSFVQWLVAMYSNFIANNAMVVCFLQFLKTTMPTRNMCPIVDCRSFASFIQSALQNPSKAISLHPRYNLKSKVFFKCLTMRLTTIQCGGPAFDMHWLTVLTAKCNIGPRGQHYIHERSYPGLVWNTFHILLHVPKFLIRKFQQFWIHIKWNRRQ